LPLGLSLPSHVEFWAVLKIEIHETNIKRLHEIHNEKVLTPTTPLSPIPTTSLLLQWNTIELKLSLSQRTIELNTQSTTNLVMTSPSQHTTL
jgi:hypothetical protein